MWLMAGVYAKRVALLALMALAAINLFTGAPLLAVWVGSRVQGDSTGLSMSAVLAVIGLLALLCWALVWLLGVLGASYDSLNGRSASRHRSPWMKPFNEARAGAQVGELRALDKILVATVVLAGLAFEAWFFFFAGSSIGH